MLGAFRRRSTPAASSQSSYRAGRGWSERVLDYLRGAGTVVDPLPIPNGSRATFGASDRDALASDWRAIGQDMRQVIQSTRAVPPARSGTSHAAAGKDITMAKMLDHVIMRAVPDPAASSVTRAWANGATTVHHFGHLAGKGVLAALSDPATFARVHVGERGRSLEWPDELDFCADALWFEAHPEDGPQPQRVGAQPAEHTAP